MFSGINRSHDTRIMILDVDNAVGKITPAEVHHIDHVKIVVGQNGQNVAEYFWNIVIANGYPVPAFSFYEGIGIIHRVTDISVFQEIHQLVSCHHGAIFFGLAGAGTDVRQQQGILTAQ